MAGNPIVQYIFYSSTGANVFAGACLVLAAFGFCAEGSFQVKNDDNIILLRKPWPGIMATNVVGLYVIWLCAEMFMWSCPMILSLSATAFFSLFLFVISKFGAPETIRFDLQERTCAQTRGWFKTTYTVKTNDILGLDLRTMHSEIGTSYLCRLRWQKGFFGWSEIGSFDKHQPALDFMEDLARKLQLPLTVT